MTLNKKVLTQLGEDRETYHFQHPLFDEYINALAMCDLKRACELGRQIDADTREANNENTD